jgi:hypothetical protein
MPPLPSPGDVLRVEFKTGDNATVEAGSRFFLSYTGTTPTTSNLNTLASDISTQWDNWIANVVSTSEALHGVIITDLSSDTGAEGNWSGTVDGKETFTASLIASAAAVVNHEISRRYRGGRPRTYLRCGGTDALASGSTNEWSSAFMSSVLTNWEGFIAAILALSGFPFTLANIVNVSWFSGNTVFLTPTGRGRNIPIKRTTPLVDIINASTIAQKVGSQRKRLDI